MESCFEIRLLRNLTNPRLDCSSNMTTKSNRPITEMDALFGPHVTGWEIRLRRSAGRCHRTPLHAGNQRGEAGCIKVGRITLYRYHLAILIDEQYDPG